MTRPGEPTFYRGGGEQLRFLGGVHGGSELKQGMRPSLPFHVVLLFVLALSGCGSMQDYIYPDAPVEVEPSSLVLPVSGVKLAYSADYDPLPVVPATLDGRQARVLLALRRTKHSIASHAVPPGAEVVGEVTVPYRTEGEIGPVTRQVVRVNVVELGGARLEGLHFMVEPLPTGISAMLTPKAFPDSIATFDGPAREFRVRTGELELRKRRWGKTLSGNAVRLQLDFLMGAGAYGSSRFMASIMSVVAPELDGSLMMGPSTSTVIETHMGPELLPAGVGGVRPLVKGTREARMDNVFGEDFDRTQVQEVEGLGSGWLVLGAHALKTCVLEIDASNRLARLDGGGW